MFEDLTPMVRAQLLELNVPATSRVMDHYITVETSNVTIANIDHDPFVFYTIGDTNSFYFALNNLDLQLNPFQMSMGRASMYNDDPLLSCGAVIAPVILGFNFSFLMTAAVKDDCTLTIGLDPDSIWVSPGMTELDLDFGAAWCQTFYGISTWTDIEARIQDQVVEMLPVILEERIEESLAAIVHASRYMESVGDNPTTNIEMCIIGIAVTNESISISTDLYVVPVVPAYDDNAWKDEALLGPPSGPDILFMGLMLALAVLWCCCGAVCGCCILKCVSKRDGRVSFDHGAGSGSKQSQRRTDMMSVYSDEYE